MSDLFMKKKMTEYIENFAFFRETFIQLTSIEDPEQIYDHYLNFEVEVCACELCRADEPHIDIDAPDEDTVPDWD